MTKQEFARIVQAWADGEEIEFCTIDHRVSDYEDKTTEWIPVHSKEPIFHYKYYREYRIKPKIKTFYVHAHGIISPDKNYGVKVSEIQPSYNNYVKIEFDEKSRKFLSAEIVEAKE